MRRSFKASWYAVISHPIQMAMLIGLVICFVMSSIIGHQISPIILLLYLLPFCVLERTLPKGRPRFLSRLLSPVFYAIRNPSGRFTIVQKRPDYSSDCKAMLRLVTSEQWYLPKALMTAPGKYRAVTHENVLNRLVCIPGAVIESAKLVYVADMSATLNYLTKGRCKKCNNSCLASIGRKTKRQFYDVRFTIESAAC